MAVAEERMLMARKIWGPDFSGWSRPHWTLNQKERVTVLLWEKHSMIEYGDDGLMMRLTDKGRNQFVRPAE